MQIIQKVLIKQIITDKSKEQLLVKFNNRKTQLEQECQQLKFEKRKLQNKTPISKYEISTRFQKELSRRREKINTLTFKIEQLDKLPIGSEIVEQAVEALVEVSVGSNWDELVRNKEIIIKDGIVIRIDNE